MTQIPVIQNPEMVNPQDLYRKTNLLGMSKAGAFHFCQFGRKPFRATKWWRWIYQFWRDRFFIKWQFVQKLQNIGWSGNYSPQRSSLNNLAKMAPGKWVFWSPGGSLVETVLIPFDDNKQFGRKTLCISSQVGCALDCSFCSTGKQGFEQDLSLERNFIGQQNQSYMENAFTCHWTWK